MLGTGSWHVPLTGLARVETLVYAIGPFRGGEGLCSLCPLSTLHFFCDLAHIHDDYCHHENYSRTKQHKHAPGRRRQSLVDCDS